MRINNATPLITNNINNANNTGKANKNVAFSGGMPKNLKDLFVLERKGNMTRYLFTLNAFVFLLGGRVLKSRDKDEKRETMTRDVPTILIAVFGVPVIKDWAAKIFQKNSGFAILQDGAEKSKFGKWVGNLFNNKETHAKSVASYDQLEDWFVYDSKLKSGFDGFMDRLGNQGGDFKKTCSHLSKEIKAELSKFKSANNAEFLTELKGNAKLKSDIMNAFANPKNKALEQAKWLKTIPTLIGFGITLFSIGIFVPKLNIAITESINKKKKVEAKPVNPVAAPAETEAVKNA